MAGTKKSREQAGEDAKASKKQKVLKVEEESEV